MSHHSLNIYQRHRFPSEVISHCAWLYFHFYMSYRDVEELMFVRGVVVRYKAIHKWCRKFGQQYVNQLHRRHPKSGDTWHLDEVFLTIYGQRHYLWRTMDRKGKALDGPFSTSVQ